jgi:hypothetical protein
MSRGTFKPGCPRPPNAGRKKGTPNKATQQLREILDAEGLDPAKKLAELLPNLTPEKQADICLKLMDFLYPKRKAVALTNEDGSALFPAEPLKREDMLELLKVARGEK